MPTKEPKSVVIYTSVGTQPSRYDTEVENVHIPPVLHLSVVEMQ